jgi:hypothetical protein
VIDDKGHCPGRTRGRKYVGQLPVTTDWQSSHILVLMAPSLVLRIGGLGQNPRFHTKTLRRLSPEVRERLDALLRRAQADDASSSRQKVQAPCHSDVW